jgi:integrase
MVRDFSSNSFKFTPDAINALVRYCRENTTNGRWRDDSPKSRGLWVYVGARGANYEQRTRKDGKYVSRKLGPANGPSALPVATARRMTEENIPAPSIGGIPGRKKRTKAKAGPKVCDVWADYIAAAASGGWSPRSRARRPLAEKTLRGYRAHFNQHIKPYEDESLGWLADNCLDQVEELGTTPDKAGKIHASLANLHLQLCRNLFDYAKHRGLWSEQNPARGNVQKFEVESRETRLSPKQRERLIEAIRTEPEVADLFIFAALSSQRIGNVCGLHWDRVDMKAGLISFESASTKQRKPNTITITKQMREVLQDRKKITGGEGWVFPGQKNTDQPSPIPRHAWERIVEKAKLKDFRIHDLRHVAVTLAAEAGASQASIMGMAGHSTLETSKRYMHGNHSTTTPALEAVGEAWEEALKKAKHE